MTIQERYDFRNDVIFGSAKRGPNRPDLTSDAEVQAIIDAAGGIDPEHTYFCNTCGINVPDGWLRVHHDYHTSEGQ